MLLLFSWIIIELHLAAARHLFRGLFHAVGVIFKEFKVKTQHTAMKPHAKQNCHVGLCVLVERADPVGTRVTLKQGQPACQTQNPTEPGGFGGAGEP